MSRVIYEVTYLPFENNKDGLPWLYSGSDYHNNPKYLGSPGSKKVLEWTDGLPLHKWYHIETLKNPNNFRKIILAEVSDNIDRKTLQGFESAIQKAENHAGDVRYFNYTNKNYNSPLSSNPNKGIPLSKQVGPERASEIKSKRSQSMKAARAMKEWPKIFVDPKVSSDRTQKYWDNLSEEDLAARKDIAKKSATDREKRRKEEGKPHWLAGVNHNEFKRWFNNGKESIYIDLRYKQPPEGFIPGRGKRKW